MGGGFGSPYGMSQQYMPNRGLMSGYSTGFGPYGGFRRPRFGGGKGGPRIQPFPYQAGGKGGSGMYGGGFEPTGYDPTSPPDRLSLEELRALGTTPLDMPYGPFGPSYYDAEGNLSSYGDRGYGSQSTGYQPQQAQQPTQQPTFDQNLQFILDQVAAGTATPGQQKFYDERYLTGEYLNNPSNFG